MPGLDFLVIGAQKSGTTTLWDLIRGHRQLELPAAKEVPFFAVEGLYALGLDRYLELYFGKPREGVLRGSVSPQYMFDTPTRSVSEIAARIALELPHVKLMAILREPIERAVSHHRMSARRGFDRRPVAEALRQQLTPGALEVARRPVTVATPPGAQARVYANNRYLASGEYGRILATYREHFPPSQLLVLLTTELAENPGAMLERVFRYLGVDDRWRPADMSVRRFVGGDDPRVSPEELRLLRDVIAAGAPEAPVGTFDVALEVWNTVASDQADPLPAELRTRLRGHFAADAIELRRLWDVDVPWAQGTVESAVPRSRPPHREPGPVADADSILTEIEHALELRTGYALIRLEHGELRLLDPSRGPLRTRELAAAGARGDAEQAARALARAAADADAVSVRAEHWPLIETVLVDLGLNPGRPADRWTAYGLLGVDPETGRSKAERPLHRVLYGRQLAAVCPAATVDWVRRHAERRARFAIADRASRHAFDVTIAVALDDLSEMDRAFAMLAAQREAYDAVLVLGELPAKPLCARLARELDVVALDLGMPLARFVNPCYQYGTQRLAAARWEIAEYVRQLHEPPPDPVHELEGRLVRAPNGDTVYIERGRARLLTHPGMLALFDHDPIEVRPDVIERVPSGAPLAIAHERLTGPFVLIDGSKRPVELGLPLVELDDLSLRDVPAAETALRWQPGG